MRAVAMMGLVAALACSPADPEPDAGTPGPDSGAAVTDSGPMPGGGAGPVADTSLGGVRWMLAEVGGTTARAAEPDRAPYLELVPSEGRATGNASCNRFSGPYSLSGDSLSLGPLVSTMMACMDSALNVQETAFLGALEQTRTWRMAGDTLVLASPAGDLAKFRAAGGS